MINTREGSKKIYTYEQIPLMALQVLSEEDR